MIFERGPNFGSAAKHGGKWGQKLLLLSRKELRERHIVGNFFHITITGWKMFI